MSAYFNTYLAGSVVSGKWLVVSDCKKGALLTLPVKHSSLPAGLHRPLASSCHADLSRFAPSPPVFAGGEGTPARDGEEGFIRHFAGRGG